MNKSSRCRARRGRRAQHGATLVEALVTAFIGTLILTGTAACMIAASSTADRVQTLGGLQMKAQRATDEMLYQLRGGSQVLTSQTLAGTSYTTSANDIVISSPGLSTDYNGFPDILTAVTDYFAYDYDADQKKLYETIVPGTGSNRPARTRMVLAKEVTAVTFTYRVREQVRNLSSGSYSKVLAYTATATPTAYVNGAKQTCSYNTSTRTATISSVPLGADVEFVYPVSPSDTSALAKVTQVDATVTLAETSGRSVTRTVTLSGTARLRNMRE